MQIGHGGSLPASSGIQNPRAEAHAHRPDAPRGHASEDARHAQKRVDPVAVEAEAASAPRRNLPRGTLINITV